MMGCAYQKAVLLAAVEVTAEMDKQIGRLLEGIKQLGIEDNTLVIFSSDNGPYPHFAWRTQGLRGCKFSLYEGGLRLPFIARWPGVVPAGANDAMTVIGSVDIFPTLCRIAGAKVPKGVAFDGVDGTKALHTCFGYAAIVHEKPNGYPFLAELDSCPADQISIEAAQPRLDPAVLEQLPSKRVILGVLDLGDMNVESGEVVAERIRGALRHIDPERLLVAPDCGMKYLPREVARGKLRALVDGAALARAEL